MLNSAQQQSKEARKQAIQGQHGSAVRATGELSDGKKRQWREKNKAWAPSATVTGELVVFVAQPVGPMQEKV